MKKMMLSAAAISAVFMLAACSNDEENGDTDQRSSDEAFTIGVIPAQTEGEMEGAMNKLQGVLTDALGRETEIDVYPDYNGVVEAMNFDQIDMAYLGPLTYVIAQEKSDAKAIITQLINGEPFYNSYIITHQDQPFESIEDLLSDPSAIDFAFGDPNSTSGSLIPSIELQDRGVYESEDSYEFSTVRFTGSHDATALAVQNEQVDAGAIDSAIYNQLIESGKIDDSQLKVIWTSEPLFQYPWAVTAGTDEETITALQEAFLAIEDPEILDAFGASGFTEATPEDYDSILDAAEKQGILDAE
ncbi:phosphate/phosphite/phosphonate ABC transporter substrate-binding protein [Jeotgalibacillus sp. JSM ZJ347]|uniref:phosphate/phosphite/phosphonate ABC transporter substrate-binding protein n=1 Tax=Jeotgalibacillus sp. JSM ZJ347 TaxID=3342117 RepID=UPI0035A8DBAA